MSFRLLSVGLLGLFLSACAGTRDARVDPGAADSVTGTGLQSMDIRAMARRFAESLEKDAVLAPGKEGQRVSFYVTELRNDSSDVIDKELILSNLQTELFRKYGRRVRFLDRSPEANELVDAERRMKARGEVSGENDRPIAGGDYALKGTIKSRDRQSGRLRSSYVVVTIQLVDLVTGELAFVDNYEMKTESEKSVINR